ncbi:unnamed protein product [Trichogramma brassicae]|uniref:Uncharacterized protein n=1 Tax=Trichogramma brassicae TaxID=86971 RepID=A0A6H5HZA1_9HYME|nr:unnamed protein product [Trichogramma brassicae]
MFCNKLLEKKSKTIRSFKKYEKNITPTCYSHSLDETTGCVFTQTTCMAALVPTLRRRPISALLLAIVTMSLATNSRLRLGASIGPSSTSPMLPATCLALPSVPRPLRPLGGGRRAALARPREGPAVVCQQGHMGRNFSKLLAPRATAFLSEIALFLTRSKST